MKTNKELKEEYKQMKFRIGVFQIRNTLNNKIFIDSSANIDAKWNRHKVQLDFGSHPNSELQKDWKESGKNNFVFEALGEVKQSDEETIDYTCEAELLKEMFIEELQPFDDKGYNKM